MSWKTSMSSRSLKAEEFANPQGKAFRCGSPSWVSSHPANFSYFGFLGSEF